MKRVKKNNFKMANKFFSTVMIEIGLAVFQYLWGINTVFNYAAKILKVLELPILFEKFKDDIFSIRQNVPFYKVTKKKHYKFQKMRFGG